MKKLYEQLAKYGDVRTDESFKKHTSFQVGGNIAYFIDVFNEQSLVNLIAYLNSESLPYKVIGKGSNLLPSEHNYEGVVINLEKYFHETNFDECSIEVGAGASLIATSFLAMQHGLSGLEFASGIPGTIGGAIFMNAGAYLSDMQAIVTKVKVLRNEVVEWIEPSELKFSYRYSILKKVDWIVLAVRLKLSKKASEEILEVMNTRKARRLAAQPYSEKSAGSTFKNLEDVQAWELVEKIGYRGKVKGGAMVSDKHCNFIINKDHASADDLLELMQEIQAKVKADYGYELNLEVELFNW